MDIIPIDLEKIRNSINELSISSIGININLVINRGDYYNQIIFNDKKHPISYIKNGLLVKNSLSIDLKYFKKHKKEILEVISYIIDNYKEEDIKISSYFVNNQILASLKANNNIKNITIGIVPEEYEMDMNIYQMFKDTDKVIITSKVCNKLKDNYEQVVGYNSKRVIFKYLTYQELCNLKNLYIVSVLSDKELEYLKFIPDNIEVKFSYDDYKQVLKIVDRLVKLGKNNKFIINVDNKNEFNSVLFDYFDELKDADITIIADLEKISLQDYVNCEKKLINLIKPALGLSPFEKYLYAYNIVKKYKKYNENEDDKMSSRDLYQILDNDYMVCVGFSILLGDLLDKLGIENCSYAVDIDISDDNIDNSNNEYESKNNFAGHDRRLVNIIDEKYAIDGIFFADPTWDNIMDNDAYNYAALNQSEYLDNRRYTRFSSYGVNELLFCSTIKEFYQKVNFLLDKREENKLEIKKKKASNNNLSESLFEEVLTEEEKKGIMVEFIEYIVLFIKKIDTKKYEEVTSKYPKLKHIGKEHSMEEIQDYLLTFGEYFVSKTNNLISGSDFKKAITVLYSNCYGIPDDSLESTIDSIMEFNKNRQEEAFPKRYKIDEFGNKELIAGIENKFDLKSMEKSL